MTAPSYNKHILALTSIFILGEGIIILPYTSGKAPIIGFLVSVILAFAGFFIVYPIANLLIIKKKSRVFEALLFLAVSFYAFYCAGNTFIRFLNFAAKVLLPNTGRVFIALVFIISVFYLNSKNKEVMFKLSLIFLAAVLICITVFIVFTAKDFSFKNIYIKKLPPVLDIYKDSLPYIKDVSLPALLIPVYTMTLRGKGSISAPFFGLLIGVILILLCLLESLLLFGVPMSAKLSFPLSAAVSTATIGPLFSRMDGVVYCLFFVSALIKTSLCIKLSIISVKKANMIIEN